MINLIVEENLQNVHLFLYYIENGSKSHFEVIRTTNYAILGKEFFIPRFI